MSAPEGRFYVFILVVIWLLVNATLVVKVNDISRQLDQLPNAIHQALQARP